MYFFIFLIYVCLCLFSEYTQQAITESRVLQNRGQITIVSNISEIRDLTPLFPLNQWQSDQAEQQ